MTTGGGPTDPALTAVAPPRGLKLRRMRRNNPNCARCGPMCP